MVRQPGEPSVEDILASISKVMARDHRGGAPAGSPPSDEAGDAATVPHHDLHPDDGSPVPVLELTDAHMEAGPDGGPEVAKPVALPGDPDDAPALAASPAPAPAETPLLAETARASLRDLLSSLAVLADRAAPAPGLRPGETSLEGMTRELLRPMLAEWLDKNLPAIVERLVADELARAVGPRG